MAWIYLLIAGLLGVVWAYGMKLSAGFTQIGASVVTIIAMLMSFGLLAVAMKSLPLGTAYAVWTGIGAVGTVLFGILLLGESASIGRLACIGLILAGIVGLKLVTNA